MDSRCSYPRAGRGGDDGINQSFLNYTYKNEPRMSLKKYVFHQANRIAKLITKPAFAVKALFPLIVCAVVMFGCASVTPPVPTPGLERPTVKSIESLQATGVVIVKKGLTMSGRATVLVQRPGSFRIEISGPFGQTVVLLISDGQSFYIYSSGDEQTMQWDDPLMPYPIKAQELVSLMTGAIASTSDEAMQAKITKDRVIKIEKTGPDGAPFEVMLSDYRDESGIFLPFNIKLTRGIEELTIKYSKVEVNAAIAPDAFQITTVK